MLRRSAAIPRTSGIEHQIAEDTGDETEEERHEDFPVSQFFESEKSGPLAHFVKRQKGAAAPLREEVAMEEVKIPEPPDGSNAVVSNPVVQMLEIHYAIAAVGKPAQLVHTWCDVMAVANVEAKRVIGAFFKRGYRELDKSTQSVKPEIRWGEKSEHDQQPIAGNSNARPQSLAIYHYIGIGYPPPEPDKICIKDTSFADGGWKSLHHMRPFFQSPCFLVFDCDHAAILRKVLVEMGESGGYRQRSFFAVFACAQNEVLRIPSHLPQDFFSCVLLSPERCFSAVTGIPIDEKGANTFVMLMDVIAESIALDVLPVNVFYRLFRGHSGVASLWRRFLLAQRLTKRFGIHVQSIPDIADMSDHRLWTQLEYGVMQINQMNLVSELSQLYLRHFDKVRLPANYVRAVVATLIQVPSERPAVLAKLADFMMQSPTNCRLVSTMIAPKSLGDYNSASRSTYFRSWCAVVSGLALASPSMGKTIVGNYTQDATTFVVTPTSDEITRVLLASTVVSSKDSQTFMTCYCDRATPERFTPLLFTTAPLVREWISLLLHASIARYCVEPAIIGPSGLHAYAMLLLYDTRKYTRAAGIAILTSIMAHGYPEYNASVMKCAMKAAIDGHRLIRLAYVYCVARYAHLNRDECSDDHNYAMDFYLRKDILKYGKDDSDSRPALRQSLLMLAGDADSEIRTVAKSILECPTESPYISEFQEHGTQIHRSAHTSLFSRSQPAVNLTPRYDEHLFHSDELEHFETRSLHGSRVTTMCFDTTHSNITCGHEDGTIIWGDNTWKLNASVVALSHLPKRSLVAASATGEIYLFCCGYTDPIEVFRPSITPPKAPTIIKVVQDTGKAFIAQGNNEIIIWDLEALLAVDHIVTSSPPVHFVILDQKLLCALTLGSIIQVDLETHTIEREYAAHAGRRITKMGECNGKLYTVIDTGELYVWNALDSPQFIAREDGVTDFCIHRLYPSAVTVTPRAAFFVQRDTDPVPLPAENKLPVCCCFDTARPMCAIGYADGSYSVWRLPKSNVSKPTFS